MTDVFVPLSAGITIAATTVAGAGVQAGTPVSGGLQQYRISNINISTPTMVYVGYGDTAAAATANAIVGPNGTAYTIGILPNTVEVFTLASGVFFSAITTPAFATTNVEITPGIGA